MSTQISRRDFMKLAALGLGSMAFRPFFPRPAEIDSGDLARVAIRSVSVYSRPDDTSTILYTRYRDELLHVYYQVESEFGPGYNPVWYRVWRGWVHSGHLQPVKIRKMKSCQSRRKHSPWVKFRCPGRKRCTSIR